MKKAIILWLIWLTSLVFLGFVGLIEAWFGPPLITLLIFSWLVQRQWQPAQGVIGWLLIALWLSGLYLTQFSLVASLLAALLLVSTRLTRWSWLTWSLSLLVGLSFAWKLQLAINLYHWWILIVFCFWLISILFKNKKWLN